MNTQVKDFDESLQRGLEKTRKEAERKAWLEKADLKNFIAMADEIKIEESYLSIDQVATQLGVSSQTIRNWEKQGVLEPVHRTEGGHRRYSQSQVIELKKNNKDFEIFLRIEPKKLMTMIEQVFSNFCSEEKVCVSIRNDELNGQVHFTIDSEDGLCTFTKTLKMED